MSAHILHACSLVGDGTGQVLTGGAVSETIKSDTLAWVHLDAADPKTADWLVAELDYLDPFVVEALTAEETRPRMVSVGNGAILILRGVNLNSGADAEDMISIRLFIDEARIISLQRRDLRAVGDIQKKLMAGTGPKSSGEFLTQIVTRLTDRVESKLTDLDDLIDDTEEKLIENPHKGLRADITNLRKKAILFRRYLAPQREAISQLIMTELPWLSDGQRRYLRESLNNIIRYIEELDSMRERAQIVKEELTNLVADRMNKNTYVLSVIAAIFLPLGFLTGLFGINIGGMPGVDSPMAFAAFNIFLVVIVLGQILLFRKMKWF